QTSCKFRPFSWPASAVSALAGGAATQRSCCSVGRGGAGGADLGSIESSTAGGVTPHAGGAVQNGKAARTPAMQILTIRVAWTIIAGSARGSTRRGHLPNTPTAPLQRARDTPALRPLGVQRDLSSCENHH